MRIAIIHGTPEAGATLERVVRSREAFELAWITNDGIIALERSKRDMPDLFLLDLALRGMDPVELVRQLLADGDTAILLITPPHTANVAKVYAAMGFGALDSFPLPAVDRQGNLVGTEHLIDRIETVGKVIGKLSVNSGRRLCKPAPAAPTAPPLVLLGASTGGPQALADVLVPMPLGIRAAFVVVQHINADFTAGMTRWLDEKTSLPVEVVTEGSEVKPGAILVAGTNDHLEMRPDRSLHYTPNPKSLPYRPSVDVFWRSVARHWPARGIAVLLTGMGRDGAEGLLLLRRRGWMTLAQDEASSTVYGMPKAAKEMGAAARVLPLSHIADVIRHALNRREEIQ